MTVSFKDGPVNFANIYCIGRNYAAHAAELGNEVPESPLVFLKSTASARSALVDSEMAYPDEEFHFECELVLLCQKHLRLGTVANATDIAGVALGIDLTRRAVQSELKATGNPWTLAKSFNGSAVLGDFVEPRKLPPLGALKFSFQLEEQVRQHGDVSLMLVKPPELMSYLLTFTDLLPGDIIFTGTPAGVGPIRRGMKYVMRILSSDYCVEARL